MVPSVVAFFDKPTMAHAASQLKKNRGEVDVNALEEEKEKRTKSRRAASREQKRKVRSPGGEESRGGRAGWELVGWLIGCLVGWLG